MIHSARLTVTPVTNIVFCCFVFPDLKSGDGRTTCAKIIILTGRDCGLAEWINLHHSTSAVTILHCFSCCIRLTHLSNLSMHKNRFKLRYLLDGLSKFLSTREVEFYCRFQDLLKVIFYVIGMHSELPRI